MEPMKNYFEKLKMALWVFSPIVIILSIYTIYLSGPVNRDANLEMINTYELPKKTLKSQSFHEAIETGKERSTEM